MKRIFTAAIAATAITLAGIIPARATTFPTLTQIYFVSGAADTETIDASGIATVITCSNMSGQTASVRYQFRHRLGTPLAGGTLQLANLNTQTVTSGGTVDFTVSTALPTGVFYGGSIQISSTQSAVYCSAILARADGEASGPSGAALHMVRFNPHPGTVE